MRLKKSAAAISALLLTALPLTFSGQAQAAPNPDSLSIYLDAPMVQGSYVAAAGASGTEFTNFNNTVGVGNCAQGLPSSLTLTGTCRIDAVNAYGGATSTADVATATVGGAGSAFATTVNSTDPITITSTGQNRYLGMWWSAGSPSNTIKFYDGAKLLLTMTTADIITLLGTAPANNTDWVNRNNTTGTNAIAAADGTLYPKVWYFGNPRGYSSTTPTAQSTITSREPFMYLHMFVGGGLTFDKVELSGGGFEFDNLTISTQAQTPSTSLYELNTIYANHVVKFDANGANTTGTMADQVNNAAANLTTNAFMRDGYTFKGWNTAANGSGTAYADAASFDFAADVTLYAQWEANTPPVDNTNAGSGDDGALAETGTNPYLGLLGGLLLIGAGAATTLKLRRKN